MNNSNINGKENGDKSGLLNQSLWPKLAVLVPVIITALAWTYYLGSELGKKADLSRVEDKIEELRDRHIKPVSAKVDCLSTRLQQTEFTIKTVVQAVNRDIVRVINKEHEETHGKLEKIELGYQTLRESLLDYQAKVNEIAMNMQDSVDVRPLTIAYLDSTDGGVFIVSTLDDTLLTKRLMEFSKVVRKEVRQMATKR